MKNIRFLSVILLVLVAALSRLLPHPPNFTAIGAMSLFGGIYLSQRWIALLVPLVSLFISDLILNNVVYSAFNNGQFVWFYDGFAWIYGSVALTVVLSWVMLRRINPTNVVLTSVICSILFFLITNFGSWTSGGLGYPKTAVGLLECYTAAIPFFINSLAGDVVFCGVLFGGFAWATRQFPRLAM